MAIAITLLLLTLGDEARRRFWCSPPHRLDIWATRCVDSTISRLESPRSLLYVLLLPVLVLAVLTAVFRLTNADVEVCRLFYGSADNAWPWANREIWTFIYKYSNIPGLVLGIGGLVVGLGSFIWSRFEPYRKAGFFFAAVLAVGPGLLVNGIFKPHWCRPRPMETADFGGQQQFAYVWSWDAASTSKSFPCGHASMGFFLMAPAFLLYRRRRRLALAFVGIGLASGSFIGLARVVQGKHFPSDVLWSGGMIYLSALALCYLFNLGKRGSLRNGVDQPARFEPFVIGAEAVADIRHAADDRLRADGQTVRRKAA